MRQGLFALLALCTLSTAMVPKDRRASEEATTEIKYCEPTTPCAWSTYDPRIKVILQNITNNYCMCAADAECKIVHDDSAVSAYVHLCRKLTDGTDESSVR